MENPSLTINCLGSLQAIQQIHYKILELNRTFQYDYKLEKLHNDQLSSRHTLANYMTLLKLKASLTC